jgi:hypothetical protein
LFGTEHSLSRCLNITAKAWASFGDREFCNAPASRELFMQHYRVYIIGQDGHFIRSIDLNCADDSAAIESAKQLIDGHDLELWQRDRRIARFDGKPE